MSGFLSVRFSSVAQSCPTRCDPMNRGTPGLPVHHQLPESTQTHVHRSWWCHPTISSSVVPFSSCPQSFPASGSFQLAVIFWCSNYIPTIWFLLQNSYISWFLPYLLREVPQITLRGWFLRLSPQFCPSNKTSFSTSRLCFFFFFPQ